MSTILPCTTPSQSLALSPLDIQRLSLTGSGSDYASRIISDFSADFSADFNDDSDTESPEMILLFNKIGYCAYKAVKSKQLKPLHIDKEKLHRVKFHSILIQISLLLDAEELNLLDKRYALPNTENGINFVGFVRDFKRLGKLLYDRDLKHKMKWKQATNKINSMGGLPDEGFFLEDLSLTAHPVVKRMTTAAVSGERALQPEPYGARAARSAAYSAAFASPFSSSRGEDLSLSLRVALQTASEIDSLRGRIPEAQPSRQQQLLADRDPSDLSFAPKVSIRNSQKTQLHMRGDKMGLSVLHDVFGAGTAFCSTDAQNYDWLADPLSSMPNETVDQHSSGLLNERQGFPVSPAGKLPLITKDKKRPSIATSMLGRSRVEKGAPNFEAYFEEEVEVETAEEIELSAAMSASEKIRQQESDKFTADARRLIPDPVDSDFEVALEFVESGHYARGAKELLKLLSAGSESGVASLSSPETAMLQYHLLRCRVLMGDYSAAQSMLLKLYTPLRLRTIFTDGSATSIDLACLTQSCSSLVALSSLVAARTMLEKVLCAFEAMLDVNRVESSGKLLIEDRLLATSKEFLICAYLEALLLKARLLQKAGASEASLFLLQTRAATFLASLYTLFGLGGLGDYSDSKNSNDSAKARADNKLSTKKSLFTSPIQRTENDETEKYRQSKRSKAEIEFEESRRLKELAVEAMKSREKEVAKIIYDKEKSRRERVYSLFSTEVKYREGCALAALGQIDEARSKHAVALTERQVSYQRYESKHPLVATSLGALGMLAALLGEFSQSLIHISESISMLKMYFPENHPYVIKINIKKINIQHMILEEDGCIITKTVLENTATALLSAIADLNSYFCPSVSTIAVNCIPEYREIAAHPSLADALYLLGEYNTLANCEPTALKFHSDCLRLREQLLVKKSLPLLLTLMKTTRHNWLEDNLLESSSRFNRVYDILVKYLGHNHSMTNKYRVEYGRLLYLAGKYDSAAAMFQATLDQLYASLVEQSPFLTEELTFQCETMLEVVRHIQGDWMGSARALGVLMNNCRFEGCKSDANPRGVRRFAIAVCHMAKALISLGNAEDIVSIVSEALHAVEISFGIEDFSYCHLTVYMAVALSTLGRFSESEPLLVLAVKRIEINFNKCSSFYPCRFELCRHIADCYLLSDKLDLAVEYYEQSVEYCLGLFLGGQSSDAPAHPEICLALLLAANASLDLAIRSNSDKDIDQLVIAYSDELIPLISKSLGESHPYSIFAKGYSGIAVKAHGRPEMGDEMIKHACHMLTSESNLKLSSNHRWILRFEHALLAYTVQCTVVASTSR